MTNELSSNWKSTNSDPQGDMKCSAGAGDDEIFNNQSKEEKLFSSPKKNTRGKVTIKRQKTMMPLALGSILAIAGAFTILVILVQGTNFLQASLTDTPLPSLEEEEVATSATPKPSPPQTQTINIGDSIGTPNSTAWPSFLKINRFTVGSSLVPDFSQTITMPINTVKNAYERVHSAAQDPTLDKVRRPPATGPELWVTLVLCVIVSSVFLVKEKKKG